MINIEAIGEKFRTLLPTFSERMRRLWAGTEARALGHGGIAVVVRATGLARNTVVRGLKELDEDSPLDPARVRRAGAGRKRKTVLNPSLKDALERLVEPVTRGDPESPLRWTSKSTRVLARELNADGYSVSHVLVADLLHELEYSLQANRKTMEGSSHPDRDAQFEYINAEVRSRMTAGQPVISVDTRKKELVGRFKNGGRPWRPKGRPQRVNVHDLFGVVRLGLDANGDRLEDLANHHTLIRQMLGVPATPWGTDAKVIARQTLRDNVALLDDALLQPINARVAAAGREVFAKKGGAPRAARAVKVAPDVLETDVHFPTDLNRLWDAARKCVALIEKYRDHCPYVRPGWRKSRDWHRRLKALERAASQAVDRGGANKETRGRHTVREYLAAANELSATVQASRLGLCDQPRAGRDWEALADFHGMLDQHRDWIARRRLRAETIPAAEKVFSLCEPHPAWIAKGKPRPHVERGHR